MLLKNLNDVDPIEFICSVIDAIQFPATGNNNFKFQTNLKEPLVCLDFHSFVKKQTDIIFQFGSIGSCLTMSNGVSHFLIDNKEGKSRLIEFFRVKSLADLQEEWFIAHDSTSQLFMSGFTFDRFISVIIYIEPKLVKVGDLLNTEE
jgi:hypothetical protein